MNANLTFSMITLIAFCVAADAAREVCFKLAAHDETFMVAIRKPVTLLGIVFWAVEMIAWAVVLERVPLSIAFPLMSLSYVAIMLAGVCILREKVSFRHAIGALLITVGVACVGATGL